MSDSVRPHRRQPTRLPRPWDSPGKNTGVGCHFLLKCMQLKRESEVAVMSDSSGPHGLQPTRLLCPWDFPGKSTGVGCHCLLHMEYYSAIKKNEIMPFAATWMELEIMILSEVSQWKTNTCHISYTWNLKRNTNELI